MQLWFEITMKLLKQQINYCFSIKQQQYNMYRTNKST